jgi:hypothetical protein
LNHGAGIHDEQTLASFSRPSKRAGHVRHRLSGCGLAPRRRQGSPGRGHESSQVRLIDQMLGPDSP